VNGDEKPADNKSVLTVVISALALNGTIGIITLAYCLIRGGELNAVLLSAFVGIVNYILGVLSGMFIKSSPTAITNSPEKPSEVKITNQPIKTEGVK
jgi:hypothetical protein